MEKKRKWSPQKELRSSGSLVKKSKKEIDLRKHQKQLLAMLKLEFPESDLKQKDLTGFLLHLAGYDYDSSYNITKRPSKFGYWIEERTVPLCNQCGAIWSCKKAETVQKNTNGMFHLVCPKCGFSKYWSTQGDDNFLDDLPNLDTFSDFWALVTMTNSITLVYCSEIKLFQ
jgi:predicted RNA-binding Zn-ribbon protein involved in translation (DUF1610 family)